METQVHPLKTPKTKSSETFQDFSKRMTAGISLAAGGAAVGAFLGPGGAAGGALVSGVAGFLMSGSHHDSNSDA